MHASNEPRVATLFRDSMSEGVGVRSPEHQESGDWRGSSTQSGLPSPPMVSPPTANRGHHCFMLEKEEKLELASDRQRLSLPPVVSSPPPPPPPLPSPNAFHLQCPLRWGYVSPSRYDLIIHDRTLKASVKLSQYLERRPAKSVKTPNHINS